MDDELTTDSQETRAEVQGEWLKSPDGARVLIVDDRKENLRISGMILREAGYEVSLAYDGRMALDVVERIHPDLLLLDVMMPEMDGFEICRRLKAEPEKQNIPVIFLTARDSTEDIVRGFEYGAVDYVTIPFRKEELLARVRTHIRLRRAEQALRDRIEGLQRTRRLVRIATGIEDVVIQSSAMREVWEIALIFHGTPDIPVVIEGETGTGKELIAKRIHYGDGGIDTPFIDINVASVTPTLFESELFGYEGGAFTGAARGGRRGKMDLAADGSLFLDEIGELPPDLQPRLLRLLQERTFYPVGGRKKRPLRARIVCATNRNLLEMVAAGRFRKDLYHRLNVGAIYIPPLRERRRDIEPLVQLFLERSARRRRTRPKHLSRDAMAYLMTHPWPGNVRELENTIERAAILCPQSEIPVSAVIARHLPNDNPCPAPSPADVAGPDGAGGPLLTPDLAGIALPEDSFDLEALYRTLVDRALSICGGNKSRAARYLGISRYALRRRLAKADTVRN